MNDHGAHGTADRVEREGQARSLLAQMVGADPQTRMRIREELVAAHLPLVRSLALKYQGRGEPLDDLVQAGSIGLLRAIDGFDPERGSEFGSYAVACILGSIRQHFREESWSVTLTRQVKERIRAIDHFVEVRTARTGRAPTVREIADQLQVSQEDVLTAIEASHSRSMVPLDAGADEGHPLADSLGMSDPALESLLDRRVIIDALQAMPEAERQALLFTTIGGLSQAEAGARMGVSQMQVHRLRTRALQRLRAALDSQAPQR